MADLVADISAVSTSATNRIFRAKAGTTIVVPGEISAERISLLFYIVLDLVPAALSSQAFVPPELLAISLVMGSWFGSFTFEVTRVWRVYLCDKGRSRLYNTSTVYVCVLCVFLFARSILSFKESPMTHVVVHFYLWFTFYFLLFS